VRRGSPCRLIEAWAGQKSFRRKDDGGSGSGGDFHGESRRNQTHASRTDPEARLYKKSAGQESRLSYLGHTLVEKPEWVDRGRDDYAGGWQGGAGCGFINVV
jgi:hypothetical protein